MLYTCTKANNIEQIKDITPETARLIRKVWKGDANQVESLTPDLDREYYRHKYNAGPFIDRKRWIIDRLLDTHDVEYLGQYKRSGEPVHYCNAGDTYATTVIFIGRRLVVGCWGDMVERGQIEEPPCAF